ncbi:aminomethyl-transferring glycine dehydrogenase [Rhodothermus marinus]|mgnify:FL=1|uniref:aminomethyl-transferring glycine dehydrogenase n=1 Tax=Rhodothermus marinus TaxID=29549 RepID=UPI000302F7F7|nr:aminomethyl-transferring glycine dehydrogenase [Rhodothermus marinus]
MAIDLSFTDRFVDRHIGPSSADIQEMLQTLGLSSLEELMEQTIPASIRTQRPLTLPPALSEAELLARLQELAAKNAPFRSFIGMGYYDTITPPVIQRNVLENPAWYTAYTPYQAEIAQGRLEALLNFQTMVIDLTGLELANASLLDEATAAAEAMMMLHRVVRDPARNTFFVSEACHPQTIAVVETRAEPLGIRVVVGDHRTFEPGPDLFGALVQYPATDGAIYDYRDFCERVHAAGAYVVVAADLLSLTLLVPPGEFGADVAVGSTQRFGIPMGYGGPHAAYFATREAFKRQVPGRIIGVSRDADGNPALRMALQTREQHIRREKATSNICTAQVLLAVMAGFYAVYHGPDGLRRIAERIHNLTRVLAAGLERLGYRLRHTHFFDTLRIETTPEEAARIREAALARRVNLRYYDDGTVGLSLDEATTAEELETLLDIFALDRPRTFTAAELAAEMEPGYQGPLARTSPYLTHPVFHRYRSETELMRYMHRLAGRDLSLVHSMIPLGSCTMKLNAAVELAPLSWPAFMRVHPFAPPEQVAGYREMLNELEAWLKEITGFAAVTFQPNSGAAGEYTGLLMIRAYHRSRGEAHRNVCLFPASAHGTNPASAVMAGMEVVVVQCDENGNIDLEDLRAKAEAHRDRLAALMVTYPSTHGVFEPHIREVCDVVHACGGLVYLDGANMNAQVGLCRPAEYGADVCHLNLHKTFAIPHGGGGPGAGPVCVAEHLKPFLPGHPVVPTGGEQAIGPVAAAPYGSASILLISWAYIALMGADGLRRASEVAILNANYLARRLEAGYDILYRGPNGRVAHEFIVDLRPYRRQGVTEIDVAKRLMDYGFHAPTVSFPVVGTMMIEPTESESKEELDRFCEALLKIREEIEEVLQGQADPERNVLKQAPHTATMVASDHWDLPYSREKAAFPAPWTRTHKFWPAVRRVDEAYGDRNLVCACPPVEAYAV